LDVVDGVQTVVFSMGFSIAFLMLVGLLLNSFLFEFGISQPLSLIPLITTLNTLILIGGVIVYLRSEDTEIWKSKPTKESTPLLSILLFLCLPILSIIGAIYVNFYGSNLILLLTIILIALVLIAGLLFKKLLPSKLYPFALLMIAIAILFHSSLISMYIVPFSGDVPVEYFAFKLTQKNAYWSSLNPYPGDIGFGRYNSMLSITIFPTIYSNLLNADAIVFKILFPVIFSFVPLGLYQLWKEYVDKKYALIATFLFIAEGTFYSEMLALNRQIIAELFFVLLLTVVLKNKMKPFAKLICFSIFSFGLITSHYALSEIFLFFFSITLIALIMVKRPSKKIAISMVVLFCALMFAWYIFTSGSATFDSIIQFGEYIIDQQRNFFDPASRGQTVLRGLGLTESPSILNTISRIFAYLTQGLIILGFIGLLLKRVSSRIKKEYFIFNVTAIAFLAMLILVPGLANTLNMSRFYHILLFFLAPFFVLGCEFLIKLLFKRKKEMAVIALTLLVLVPYFLFQTNFIYEVTGGDSWSIPLSGYRMSALRLYGSGYTDTQSVYGAQWMSKNVNVENLELYADRVARNSVLLIYGMIFRDYVQDLSNVTMVADNGVVYLRTLNVVEGVIPFGELYWNSSDLSSVFNDLNIIYSNGGSEIYKNSR
jgi:uncharacterized membrane protein